MKDEAIYLRHVWRVVQRRLPALKRHVASLLSE